MNFFHSDAHINDPKILEFTDRNYKNLDEMLDKFIYSWNTTIDCDDHIYILGDFIFGSPDEISRVLKNLNGIKHLIRGNHDRHTSKRQIRLQYEWIKDMHYGYIGDQLFTLCHYPILDWEGKSQGSILLHGHIHNFPIPFCDQFKSMINVSSDVIGPTPITQKQIMKIHCGQQNRLY